MECNGWKGGNQRDIDRQRAAKRHANDPKKGKEDGAFASVKRQQNDADIMRAKQEANKAKKDEEAAAALAAAQAQHKR
ncbi:hypothetical protein PROFUN_01001 [Planoprotostelium fungivorum]|uniref:Small EDRK-rich factor-like N-terminal domain-containing protein n=1 Tax=Planoprotostelium fungivorum TaxID=1890364 RepID=A0A2P6N4F1_9EUKA|nr:hypothetical protein PROFUN_01001 [Planoprotostelium fungivorum]